MKTAKVFFTLLLLGAILGAASSSYAYSTKLYVQGRLTTAAGTALPNGTYPITFKIYVSETAITPLWYDTFTAVSVSAGTFSVTLGSQKALTSAVLLPDKPTLPAQVSVCSSDKRWLEVVVEGEVYGPRVKINTCGVCRQCRHLGWVGFHQVLP